METFGRGYSLNLAEQYFITNMPTRALVQSHTFPDDREASALHPHTL